MKFSLLSVRVITFLLSMATYADLLAGDLTDNPGDRYSQEFVELGYSLVEELSLYPVAGVDHQLLFHSIVKTRVIPKDRVFDDEGIERDALSHRHPDQPWIELSKSSWEQDQFTSWRKMRLVFHEYLLISGYDDTKYQYSARLNSAHVCERSDYVKHHLENDLIRPCYFIKALNLKYLKNMHFDLAKGNIFLPGDFAGVKANALSFYWYAKKDEIKKELSFDLSALANVEIQSEFDGESGTIWFDLANDADVEQRVLKLKASAEGLVNDKITSLKFILAPSRYKIMPEKGWNAKLVKLQDVVVANHNINPPVDYPHLAEMINNIAAPGDEKQNYKIRASVEEHFDFKVLLQFINSLKRASFKNLVLELVSIRNENVKTFDDLLKEKNVHCRRTLINEENNWHRVECMD